MSIASIYYFLRLKTFVVPERRSKWVRKLPVNVHSFYTYWENLYLTIQYSVSVAGGGGGGHQISVVFTIIIFHRGSINKVRFMFMFMSQPTAI